MVGPAGFLFRRRRASALKWRGFVKTAAQYIVTRPLFWPPVKTAEWTPDSGRRSVSGQDFDLLFAIFDKIFCQKRLFRPINSGYFGIDPSICGGSFPSEEDNGIAYLKIPVNAL